METSQSRREKFRKGLSDIYLPFYDGLCDVLPDEWQPFSGLRSMEEQEGIYASGRTKKGLILTNAKPGFSFHNYGLASDWILFRDGQPQWNLQGNDWLPYQKACDKVGSDWGGHWSKFIDRPHNQLPTGAKIQELYSAYTQGGVQAAVELAEKMRS